MTKFELLKQALDVLPRPTLIMCKSNRRAGLVWATYTGKLCSSLSSPSYIFVLYELTS